MSQVCLPPETKSERSITGAAATTSLLAAGAIDSPLGWIAACWQGDVLRRVTIGHATRQAALSSLRDLVGVADDGTTEAQAELLGRLRDVAAGAADDLRDVAIDLSHLRPFARRVAQRCRRIPRGQTRTYAQLAAACGSPRAARAVGNAMAGNRYPLIVPCHRVVGSGGGLGGFSAPTGLELKRRLLLLEGAEIARG